MAKLYFNYAAMNAGKSATLLQSSFNYRERGMKTIEFTAQVDTREGTDVISSRIGLSRDAITFSPRTNLYDIMEAHHRNHAIACVFLDEAQFLTAEQVHQLARIVDALDIPTICYGLRTDFLGRLFEGSASLFALADEIRELKTICHCGRKATMNLRIDEHGNAVTEGDPIEIGGNDRYTPLCRKHYFDALGSTEPTSQ